jgi:uncharacterized membrane protein YidH (DUF202 family)
MSWKRWKIGLISAIISTAIDGFIVSFADPSVVAHFKEHVASISIGMLVILFKAMGLYMREHPIDQITDNTEIITKQSTTESK